MGYSIHGQIPTPQIVRFETDRPALLDRYDDIELVRQNLLIHNRLQKKIVPNETILKQLRKKKRKLKKTKNLKGELAQNIKQQKRFERGERRDKPEQEPRIIGEAVRGEGGVAFDPDIEREKIAVEREKILLGQGRLALEGRQLNINRTLANLDRDERIRQFNEALQDRNDRERREVQREEEARRLRQEQEAEARQQALLEDRRIREQQLEFDERRAEQAGNQARRELEARLGGEQEILRINREAEFRLLEERGRIELARGNQERERRADEDAQRQLLIDASERERREQLDLLRQQGDLNRQVIDARLSEHDREREQRREQRQAEFLQRGLHEINAVIDRRLAEAREEFRRGGLADPEPEITILGGAERARRESTADLGDRERANLSQEIADQVRQALAESPSDIVARQRAEARAEALDVPPATGGTGSGSPRELTPSEQRRVGATRRALARRSPSPRLSPASSRRSPRRSPSPRGRRIPQTERERQAEEEFYERQPSPASPLPAIPAERLRRGGGRGTGQYESESDLSGSTGSGELVFSLEDLEQEGVEQRRQEAEPEPPAEEGGGFLGGLVEAGRAVAGGVSHVVQRGAEAFEELNREAGRGQQQGGILEDPSGERLVGLGQEIEVDEPLPVGRGAERAAERLAGGAGLPGDAERAEAEFQDLDALGGGAEVDEAIARAEAERDRQRAELDDLEEGDDVIYRGADGAEQPAEIAGINRNVPVGEAPQIAVRVGGVVRDTEADRIRVGSAGQGVQGAELRDNYAIYQSLVGDLDTHRGRRGGKRTAGEEEFIPFKLTNVSDKTSKKLQPGQTVKIKGVLGTGELRFEVDTPQGTRKSQKIGRRALEKQIRNGILKLERDV